jgi:hypothetical protein
MPEVDVDYVFGYGSLVELQEPVTIEGRVCDPVPGRLRCFHRRWGAAMNNWEATEFEKHFVDPETGEKPKIRVAYLDIEWRPGSTVNGLALPVDSKRLADLDIREVNYIRIDVTESFEPPMDGRVFTYTGTMAARERSRAEDDVAAGYVSRDYVSAIRRAFAALGDGALAEFDRTTEPLQFPERHLELRYPPPSVGESG